MPNGCAQAEVIVGSFVEAVFVADSTITRRGVVICVLNPKTIMVKGKDFESLCENPLLIPKDQLTLIELELIKTVLDSYFLEKGGQVNADSDWWFCGSNLCR